MPPASQHKNEWVETMNNLGIDVGKKKCRAALKDERGEIISEFFTNNNEGISALIKTASYYGKCTGTGTMKSVSRGTLLKRRS